MTRTSTNTSQPYNPPKISGLPNGLLAALQSAGDRPLCDDPLLLAKFHVTADPGDCSMLGDVLYATGIFHHAELGNLVGVFDPANPDENLSVYLDWLEMCELDEQFDPCYLSELSRS